MSTQSSEANAVVDDEYPLILIGRDHRVSYANVRAHQLFGFEHGGLHGMSIEQLLAPSRRTEVRNVQAVLRGQASRRFRSVTRCADGSLIDVNLALEPCLDHRGSVVAVKLRCERILRSEPPAHPASFAASSGTRPIPPRSGVPPPPPPKSGRVAVVRPPSPKTELVLTEDGAEQLETALQLLGWLRQRIQAEDGPLGCPRERARVLLVLNETTELVAECRCDLKREVKPRARRA